MHAEHQEIQTYYDVIVIGAGSAGLNAAIEVKKAGLDVVIFEKMDRPGGNSKKASSGMNASETRFQKEQNIQDSNQLFFDETLKGGHGTNNQTLLRYFVDHGAEAIDQLNQENIILSNLTIAGGMSVKRTHRPNDGSPVGNYLVQGLLKKADSLHIPILTHVKALEIKMEDQAMTGVKIALGKVSRLIRAQAVIVTTGGFGANKEMIAKLRPEIVHYISTNSPGTTGDGLKMLKAIGAQLVDLDEIQVHPTVQQDEGILIGEAVRGEGAILVNQMGQRFVNELETRDHVSAAIIKQPEKCAYLIFDQSVRERAKAIEFYDYKGYVFSGDTIEELAHTINVDPKSLKQTVTHWNHDIEENVDPDYNRPTRFATPLVNAPYQAIKIAPGIHFTMGGVKINENAEVLDQNDQPIKGVYAAGEVVGGLHGKNRLGGNAIAETVIFGRQAGQQVAHYIDTQK